MLHALIRLLFQTSMILYIFLLVIPLAAIAWHRFKRYILVNFTALADIQQAGVPRKTNERIPGRAVIVGGSITGLCVARVLSGESRTVSERSELINYKTISRRCPSLKLKTFQRIRLSEEQGSNNGIKYMLSYLYYAKVCSVCFRLLRKNA